MLSYGACYRAFRNTAIGITGGAYSKSDPEPCGFGPTMFNRITSVKDWIAENTVGDAVFDSKCRRIDGELHSVISVI